VGGKVGTGPGAPSGQISEPPTVTVDNACELHKPALTEATTPTCQEFDPSNGDVYVLDVGHRLVDKFTATGKYLNQITTSGAGVNVDPTGHLWGWENEGQVKGYSDSEVNELLSTWIAPYEFLWPHFPGFVVDPRGGSIYVYSTHIARPPTRITYSDSGSLLSTESVGSQLATGLADEATTHDIYVDTGSEVTRYSSGLAPLEQLGSGTLSEGSGVSVNNATEDLYIADSVTNDVKIFIPHPPSAPTIADRSVSAVTDDSATVDAAIEPNGASTTYRVEYGPTTAYGHSAPSPEGDAGSDYEVDKVAIPVQDLLAHTLYHYRIVATNGYGTEYGKDALFTTQATGVGLTLPDERSWEMVSPPHKNGALFFGTEWPVQAAANGDALVDLASQPTEDSAEGSSAWADVLMTRGSSQWTSQTISSAHTQSTGRAAGSEYLFFSDDLSRAFLQPYGSFTALSPEASQTTPYLRTDYMGGDVNEHCTAGCFQPLVTANNTVPGAEFGEFETCIAIVCGPTFLAATSDLSHVLLASNVQLTSEQAPKGGTYEWSAGALRLVSSERSVAGGRQNRTVTEAWEQRSGMQAISANGERVILGGGGTEGIYLHEMSSGANTRIDEPQGGAGPSENPQFVGASSDASKIFFIDSGPLTATSAASGDDLYEYDINRPASERLTDLSVDANSGEVANVQMVLGESKDGSYIYFSAAGVLAPGASPSVCTNSEEARTGAAPKSESCNIYVRHDGVTSFVSDGWPGLGGSGELSRVSPDGQWLAFMSSGDITGYDTRDAITGEPDQEVYLYGAFANHLTCASCDPTGARPVGVNGRAATVPSWVSYQESYVLPYQPRFLSDGGRLFFNTYDALVPQDIDGTEDVYEFEPQGTGRCSSAASGYVEAMAGCLGLISSGTSSEGSSFVDASESGGDVFFRTAAKLVPQDFDDAMDIYDAHECSTAVPCLPVAPVSPPSCATGDACKPAPTPQPGLFGPAPSATFSGPGNVSAPARAPAVKAKPLTRAQKLSRALKACRTKRSRQRRRSCEAAARKTYGPKAGKANSKKKGGR
jgi:hypothetical protein